MKLCDYCGENKGIETCDLCGSIVCSKHDKKVGCAVCNGTTEVS